MKVIPLEQNYRSHQNILDLVFPMIEHNYAPGQLENLRVKLRSDATEEAQPIDLVTAGNSEAADAYLVAKLKELQASKPEDKIAVIVRLNRDVRRVLSLLERNGLSAAAERGADLFAYPLGFLYFSLLEYLADPSRAESLAACVAGGLWDFNIETRASVIKDIKSGKLSEVHSRIPALSELRAQIARAGALEFLISAGQTSGITVLAAHDPLSAEVWRGIISLAEELVALGSPDDPKRIIQDLLLHRDSGNARGVKIHVGLPDSQISIMTAHGSKGLEFDYVFMPYATEESWMSRGHNSYFVLPRESDSEDEERDVRRLFYVALTRARKHISIIVPLQDGSDRLLTPVRFLSELGQAQLAKTDLPAVVVDVSARNGISQSKYDLESINYAKKVLTERGLSVTALNHFMKCPSEFFIKSILKLPEPPSTSAEKGNAMHLSMDKVWHLPVRDPEKIASCIEKTVKEYFADSLLLLVEKEAVVRELAAAAPVVAVALSQHFALQGAIATETWAERPLEFNPDIRIPLHGKLDAVVENAGEVLVFDYKTQEAMSVNAIKGETKNDDGNYFRQLVFYKIILSDKFKNKKIQPALVFIKPDAKGRCPIISLPVEESDISRVKGEIQQLVDSVWSGNFLKEKCDDEDCRYCAMRTAMS